MAPTRQPPLDRQAVSVDNPAYVDNLRASSRSAKTSVTKRAQGKLAVQAEFQASSIRERSTKSMHHN
jgi:hypothetical protein